ncbi:serine hydrolase [Aestuariibacter sp. A3R04]|uniref:serine hydrolase domain-containing protein n=1 Tax=Aestuariibacter sp. A3R04 TaxID=2841571 RepID=UPI001C09D4EE|nr:serine hydrolase domain-containing protein [Aestuariibacter sp. A3R04]MBU3023725.1 beta-lactamase family protein [Aestuariibacter sp. A3R04]
MSTLLKLTGVIFLLLFCRFGIAEAHQLGGVSALDEKIQELVQQHRLSSVSYGIVDNNGATHIATIGMADLQSKNAVTQDTVYRVASVSKMIVGIAIMQLVESGQLNLDDTLVSHVPDVPFKNPWRDTAPLKVLHLVENTTGWRDISLKAFAYNNEPRLSLVDALAVDAESRTSRWPPGSRHAYTNSAAVVAALIVERITGMPFAVYAQQYIFAPLDINSATYANNPTNLATGYAKGSAVEYKPVLMTYAGGLSISTGDAIKLLSALANRNEALLSPSGYERMEHSHGTNAGIFPAGYGVYNYARYYDGWRFRGHDGSLPGWLSEFSYSPEFNTGFFVLQNTENGAGFRAVVKVISDYLTAQFPAPELEKTDEHANKALHGYYRYQNLRNPTIAFLERIASSNKLAINENQALFSGVFPPGWHRELHYAGQGKWKNDKNEIVMVEANDPVLGKVIHYGDRVFKQESTFLALADKVVLVCWLLLFVVLSLVTPVWIYKLWKNRYTGEGAVFTRRATLISLASTWSFLLFLLLGLMSPITRLGSPGVVSVGLWFTSIIFALGTAYSTYLLIRHRNLAVNPVLRILCYGFTLFQIIVVLYLCWHGTIGIVSWQ